MSDDHRSESEAVNPMREAEKVWSRVKANSSLVTVCLLMWLAIIGITRQVGTAAGTAAGTGGGGHFGAGGSGEGYTGAAMGGGGGTGNDPVPDSGDSVSNQPQTGAESDADGDLTAQANGPSVSDFESPAGDVSLNIISMPQTKENKGQPSPGTGAGSGNEGSDFMGIRASGRNFVYILDNSGSMSGAPYNRAVTYLFKTVHKLNGNQKFYVMFFNDVTQCQLGEVGPPKSLKRADSKNKKQFDQWLRSMGPNGGTQPEQALMWAISLEPSAIFFMTDGQFDPAIVNRVTAANQQAKIPIHTIAFVTNIGEGLLRDLAKKNRGKYKFLQ